MNNLPLEGLLVLEFSQYLSGPAAALRLADLGARVIKIERPGTGDAGRKLAIKNLWVDDSSLLFHTINRNKESVVANLKDEEDLLLIKRLIEKTDVMIHNFRPGVMEKAGLGYQQVKNLNPKIIYAEISGYGTNGPWKDKPGQDLLLQAMTGLAHTTGNNGQLPMPFGIAVADILCGSQLVQGILAALIRRQKKGCGALIQNSLFESLLDFQFELLTTYFTDKKQPKRSGVNYGHPLLSAPYGIYTTANGFLAIAMVDLQVLSDAIECVDLKNFDAGKAFSHRDEIKKIIADQLLTHNTAYWLNRLHNHNIWAMEVLDWNKMTQQPAYKVLQMEQPLQNREKTIYTTRCPIRINGERLFSEKPAPQLGEHNFIIQQELLSSL